MANASSKKWWKNAVIYQINPRSFCDSNGDGIGDIAGIISKLHYLKELGVDAIWLGPIFPSPGHANGYDISDYKGINPELGTMEDMEKLISRAKRLGIKIIIDLVINHTSDEHEWFKKALEGDPKYRNYYYFRTGKGKGFPNNWTSFLGGRAWTKTDGDDYYLHLFSKHQPDLNWHNPDVYDEITDIMRFWLDKGVAGFKCNMINIIYKKSLDDGKKRMALTGREHYLNASGYHELIRRFNEDVWSKYKTFIVGEPVFANLDEAKLLSDESRKELDSVFFSNQMNLDNIRIKGIKNKYNAFSLVKTLDKWQESLDIPATYFQNHDQLRSIKPFGNTTKYLDKSTKLFCGLGLSLKGIPFICEGEEIGNANTDIKNENVEGQNEDSILSFYKKMIAFRKDSQAILEGSYRRVASPSDVYLFTRESMDERLYIYCNLTNKNKSVEFYGEKIIFGNYDEQEREDFYLKPYEFRIVATDI